MHSRKMATQQSDLVHFADSIYSKALEILNNLNDREMAVTNSK